MLRSAWLGSSSLGGASGWWWLILPRVYHGDATHAAHVATCCQVHWQCLLVTIAQPSSCCSTPRIKLRTSVAMWTAPTRLAGCCAWRCGHKQLHCPVQGNCCWAAGCDYLLLWRLWVASLRCQFGACQMQRRSVTWWIGLSGLRASKQPRPFVGQAVRCHLLQVSCCQCCFRTECCWSRCCPQMGPSRCSQPWCCRLASHAAVCAGPTMGPNCWWVAKGNFFASLGGLVRLVTVNLWCDICSPQVRVKFCLPPGWFLVTICNETLSPVSSVFLNSILWYYSDILCHFKVELRGLRHEDQPIKKIDEEYWRILFPLVLYQQAFMRFDGLGLHSCCPNKL